MTGPNLAEIIKIWIEDEHPELKGHVHLYHNEGDPPDVIGITIGKGRTDWAGDVAWVNIKTNRVTFDLMGWIDAGFDATEFPTDGVKTPEDPEFFNKLKKPLVKMIETLDFYQKRKKPQQ